MIRSLNWHRISKVNFHQGLLFLAMFMCIRIIYGKNEYTFINFRCQTDSSSTNNKCEFLSSSSCIIGENGILPYFFCEGYSVPGTCIDSDGQSCIFKLNVPCGRNYDVSTCRLSSRMELKFIALEHRTLARLKIIRPENISG